MALQLAEEIGIFYGQLVVTGLVDRVAEIDADWDLIIFHVSWNFVLTDGLPRESLKRLP